MMIIINSSEILETQHIVSYQLKNVNYASGLERWFWKFKTINGEEHSSLAIKTKEEATTWLLKSLFEKHEEIDFPEEEDLSKEKEQVRFKRRSLV